jgi:hypothetical protein
VRPFYVDAQGQPRFFDKAEIWSLYRYMPWRGALISRIVLFVQLSGPRGPWLRGEGGRLPDPDARPFTTWTDTEWERINWTETTLGDIVIFHRQTGCPLPPWLVTVVEAQAIEGTEDPLPPAGKARDKKPKKGGRKPMELTPEERRIYEVWETDFYATYKDMKKELGLGPEEWPLDRIRKLIGRCRKREQRRNS